MSGTHGLLQPNQPGYYYITLEEGYVTLFKINANKWFEEHKNEAKAEKKRDARSAHAVAKAYITDVLENLSKDLYKETESEQNLWVFLSFPQLESRLHGGVKMRTLKDAMKEMIEDGYIFKRPNRDPRYKSLEYRLNLPKYRKELNELPTKDVRANLHDGIDSADLHDVSANLHDDDANLHDDSADSHARKNIDITKNKQNESTSDTGNSAKLEDVHPSTPSLSQLEQLSTPVESIEPPVDNSPETQLPIATVTTGNASVAYGNVTAPSEPELPSNVHNTEPLLSPGGRRVRDYWSQLGFESTSASNTHWNTLSKHITSFEQMDSLYEYARAKLKNADDPTVHPGNLVKAVNGWKQKQAPDLVAVGAQQSKPKTKKQAEEEWIASLKADPWK